MKKDAMPEAGWKKRVEEGRLTMHGFRRFRSGTAALSLTLIAVMLVLTLAACRGGSPATQTQTSTSPQSTATSTTKTGRVILTGAGSSFAYPLYSSMFAAYGKLSGTDINYQSVGSGAGIQQITKRTVDFGATDGIMTQAQETAAPSRLLHIATASGAVAIVYNVPGVSGLKLTGDELADIFLGKLTKWNDPRIAATNPGTSLPSLDIAAVHRADGSGTTNIFTNYLSKVSQDWQTKVGSANSVNWPGGIGGQGSEGVAGQVRQIPGAIGYAELAYATTNNMPFASLKNLSGAFVTPTLEATTAAATGVALPADMKVMITDSANPAAYPICGFTWVLAYQEQSDGTKGKALTDALWWAVHDGQKYTTPLLYAPLSQTAVARNESLLRSIIFQGVPFIK